MQERQPEEGIVAVNQYTLTETIELPGHKLRITLHLEHHRGYRVCGKPGWNSELRIADLSDDKLRGLIIMSHGARTDIETIRHWLTQFNDESVVRLVEIYSMRPGMRGVHVPNSPERAILRAMLRFDDKLAELQNIPDDPDDRA